MASASITDADSWASIWHTSTPSSQAALCLLMFRVPLRWNMLSIALLVLAGSSDKSMGGLTLLLLQAAAIREMLVGMSSREPSTSLMLAWEDVSAGGGVDFWPAGWRHGGCKCGSLLLGRLFRFTAGCVCHYLSQKVVNFCSHAAFRYWGRLGWSSFQDDGGLANKQSLCVQFPFEWDVNLQIGVLIGDNTFTTAQWFWQSGYNRFVMSIQTGGIDHLGAGGEELVDIKLADLSPGGLLCLSLGQDAQVFALGEWCMIRTLIQLH